MKFIIRRIDLSKWFYYKVLVFLFIQVYQLKQIPEWNSSLYKITTLYWNEIFYVLNNYFHSFAYRNITKLCKSIHFGYSDILNKLAKIIYPLCFRTKTVELLSSLSFKAELPTTGRHFFFGFWNLYRRKKPGTRPLGIPKIFRSIFSTIWAKKWKLLFLYPCSKVIGSINFELRISNYRLKICEFFW